VNAASAYARAIPRLLLRQDLGAPEAEAVMAEIMDGALEPAAIAALLTALAIKGECAAEIAGFARAMRARAIPVRAEDAIDTCGTGGSGQDKPNISSLAAVVLAAGGVRVAKHGNRSNTGRCGSADVFERLGVPIDLGPEAAEALLAQEGLSFLFAPRFHPAMKHAGPVRRALGFRTAFNLLGPLANPAGVKRQVLGVSDPHRAPLLAEALLELGVERALVVCSEDGLDEVSTERPTLLWSIEQGEVHASSFDPSPLGLAAVGRAAGAGTVEGNAQLFLDVLAGRADAGLVDAVALNAAAGFVVSAATSFAEGLARARELLRSGAAERKLASFRAAARQLAGLSP
jgi:anthranilate phosphoribosyltransferase